MSQSNPMPVASCSKSDPTLEDGSELKKATSTKLIETRSRKLNSLQIFDDRTSVPSNPSLGIPSEMLALRCQQLCQNMSFKSLPPLGARDSLENIRIRRYGEFPQRNLLRSFVKANNLEKRPRRRLRQNKVEVVAGSNESGTLNSKIYPKVNAKKLRYQLAIERKVQFNRFSIGRFGQNISNQIRGEALKGQFGSAMCQGLSYEEVVSLCKDDVINLQIASENSKAWRSRCCTDVKSAVDESELRVTKANKLPTTLNVSHSSIEMLCSLEKLNLHPTECQATVRSESLETSQQTPDIGPLVNLTLKKNDLSTWFKNASINERLDRKNCLKECNDECGLDFQELNQIECKTEHFPIMEVAKDNSFVDLQSCPSKMDFSSGDDTRNLTSNLNLDGTKSVCKMTCVEERQNQNYESRRRSVQWNSEVDVIYYAGDTDGGKTVCRKREPLREEADQQARRNGFIKLALNRNLISAFNTFKFPDPRIAVYHK